MNAAVIAAVVAIAAAASAPLTASSETQLKTAASRLVLSAVTDAQDRPLVDLDPDDFAIAENGSEREIVSVYVADYPVVVLLDEGTTATSDVQAIRSAVVRFISRLGPRAVAIGTLADPPAIVASFEDDRAAALARLENAAINPTATLAPIEAVVERSPPDRRDRRALLRHCRRLGAADRHVAAGRARPVADDLRERRVRQRGRQAQRRKRRPADAATPDAPTRICSAISSDQTHGQYIAVFSAASYSVALDRLADRLATEMMIQYLIPSGAPEHGRCASGREDSGGPGQRIGGIEIGGKGWKVQPFLPSSVARSFDLLEGLLDQPLVVFLRQIALKELRRDHHRQIDGFVADLLQRALRSPAGSGAPRS